MEIETLNLLICICAVLASLRSWDLLSALQLPPHGVRPHVGASFWGYWSSRWLLEVRYLHRFLCLLLIQIQLGKGQTLVVLRCFCWFLGLRAVSTCLQFPASWELELENNQSMKPQQANQIITAIWKQHQLKKPKKQQSQETNIYLRSRWAICLHEWAHWHVKKTRSQATKK